MLKKTFLAIVQSEVEELDIKKIYKEKVLSSIIRSILFVAVILSTSWLPNWILFIYIPISAAIHISEVFIYKALLRKVEDKEPEFLGKLN